MCQATRATPPCPPTWTTHRPMDRDRLRCPRRCSYLEDYLEAYLVDYLEDFLEDYLEDFLEEYLVATVAPSRWVGQAPPRPWWPDQTRFLTARA